LLGIHTFDATRKRMSMVFRTPDGRFLLLIKGADNVIMDRAADGPYNDILVHHLVDFARLGLRTLVLAQRYMSHSEAEHWLAEYKVIVCLFV
jgi:magnesium-transporting ATPase (P-type)